MIFVPMRINREFPYLDKKSNRWILIFSTLIYGIFFLNVYYPFNINQWYDEKDIELTVILSSIVIMVCLVQVFTQFILRPLMNYSHLTFLTFIIHTFIEILLVSVLVRCIYGQESDSITEWLAELIEVFRYVILILVVPYSAVLTYFYYKRKYNSIKEKLNLVSSDNPLKNHSFINFSDEKGNHRFSLLSGSVVLIESTDNYVTIYYLNDKNLRKFMLRNSLRQIASMLEKYRIVRCHRSYIVNLRYIKILKQTSKSIKLQIPALDNKIIPVSRTYLNYFVSFLNSQP